MADIIPRIMSDYPVSCGIIRLKICVKALAPDDPSLGLANSDNSSDSVWLPYDIADSAIVYWLDARYIWNDDNTSLTAERPYFDGSRTESETVPARRELISAPAWETPGSYSAVSSAFSNPAFEIREKADESCVISPLSELNVLVLPASITEIQDNAFEGISAEAVILPDSCRYVGSGAFADCKELLYIRIPAGAGVAGDAFDGSLNVAVDLVN